jgi:hypothetical protein
MPLLDPAAEPSGAGLGLGLGLGLGEELPARACPDEVPSSDVLFADEEDEVVEDAFWAGAAWQAGIPSGPVRHAWPELHRTMLPFGQETIMAMLRAAGAQYEPAGRASQKEDPSMEAPPPPVPSAWTEATSPFRKAVGSWSETEARDPGRRPTRASMTEKQNILI